MPAPRVITEINYCSSTSIHVPLTSDLSKTFQNTVVTHEAGDYSNLDE